MITKMIPKNISCDHNHGNFAIPIIQLYFEVVRKILVDSYNFLC